MPITHAEHNQLKKYMEDHMARYINEGLLQWSIAAEGAVEEASDPDDADSIVYWLISLAGNLLWAATVFFPPAGIAAAASTATKAASLLGATLGSDTARKALQNPSNTADAKSFLRDAIATKGDQLNKMFVASAADWIANNLAKYVTNELRTLAHLTPETGSHLVDEDAEKFMASVQEDAKLQEYTLENFIFPGGFVKGSELRASLRKWMVVELNRALVEYKRQYRDWQAQARSCAGSHMHYPLSREDYARFEEDWKRQNPFSPHIRFHGVPADLHGPNYLTMPCDPPMSASMWQRS
jgi:hypothetical protein